MDTITLSTKSRGYLGETGQEEVLDRLVPHDVPRFEVDRGLEQPLLSDLGELRSSGLGVLARDGLDVSGLVCVHDSVCGGWVGEWVRGMVGAWVGA